MANIEWKTQQQIDEEELENLLIPSQEEIKKAELEMSMINLLVELEVI